MTVVAVSFDGVRISGAESITDGGLWDKWDSNQNPGSETDFFYQGTQSISIKVGSAQREGIELFNASPTVNFTTNSRTILLKLIIINYADLNIRGATGLIVYVGSGTTTDRYEYYVHGNDTYPIAGGWIFVPINPTLTAYRDVTDGSPVITAIDYYAVSSIFSASSQASNVAIDAIDYIDNGTGLTLVSGTGADPDGTFQDFIDFDEGEGGATDRMGIVRTVESVIYVLGTLIIGSATETDFTDTGRTLVFPGGLFGAGFQGLAIGLQASGSVINLSSCVFIGRGKADLKGWFDTELDINGTNDEITITGHEYFVEDQVLYSDEGGSESSLGLTDLTEYFIEVVDADTISLHTTRTSALTSGTPVDLTASTSGNGENHSLRRQPDTRPDLTVTGTSGSSTLTACSFFSFSNFSLTSVISLISCTFNDCSTVTLNQGTLDTCTINNSIEIYGEAAVITPDLSDISDCIFVANSDRHAAGHAVEITATGTFTYAGNTHTGYGLEGASGVGWEFDTTTDVTGGATDTISFTGHGMTTGDPIYYEKQGGTASIGLTDAALYFVRVDDANTLGIFLSLEAANTNVNRIDLTSTGAETHALYSAYAGVHNSSGGLVTINITGGGDSPSIRNSGGSTTTVSNSVTLTVTVKDESGTAVGGARVRIEEDPAGTLVVDGTTNGSGVFTDSIAFSSDIDVTTIVRLKRFIPFETTGTIDSSGLSVSVRFIADTIVD